MNMFAKVFKLRRRGATAAKASQLAPEELPGQYSKGQFTTESLDMPQGT